MTAIALKQDTNTYTIKKNANLTGQYKTCSTAYSYLWTLSKINNYATVEERKKKWLQTIFPFSHPPLSPHSNSLSLVLI